MSPKQYDDSRPAIPAEITRSVKVEAGHQCAIKACPEHTYLEIHHINENRENNRIENLILLCDKHHKMAHAGVIDRKALLEYKKLLHTPNVSTLLERLEKLESLLAISGAIPGAAETPDRSINLILEEAALLGNKLRGTPEGNELAQQMFSLIRKYGNKMGVGSVDLMVIRGETYSRTGLSGLGVLYDEFFAHAKTLNLVEYFESKGMHEVAYYCALRESFPTDNDMSACMQSRQFRWGSLRVVCDEYTLLSKYPNRGPSIILDCLTDDENAQQLVLDPGSSPD